jgi:hypothetical protein
MVALYHRLTGRQPQPTISQVLAEHLGSVGEMMLSAMMRESHESTGCITPATLTIAHRKLSRRRQGRIISLPSGDRRWALGASEPPPPNASEGPSAKAREDERLIAQHRATGEPPPLPSESHPVWRAALAELRSAMTPENYVTWLYHTRVVSEEADELVIAVPNQFSADWLTNKLQPRIRQVLQRLGHADITIRYVVQQEAADKHA